jgi:hypothetical protein
MGRVGVEMAGHTDRAGWVVGVVSYAGFLWLLLHCVTEQRDRDSESLGMQMAIVASEKGAWFSDLYFTLLGKHLYFALSSGTIVIRRASSLPACRELCPRNRTPTPTFLAWKVCLLPAELLSSLVVMT